MTEVNDVMNTSQKITESQRDIDDLTSAFMTEKRHSLKKVKILTSHSIRKELNDWKWSDEDLQQQQNKLKSKWNTDKIK